MPETNVLVSAMIFCDQIIQPPDGAMSINRIVNGLTFGAPFDFSDPDRPPIVADSPFLLILSFTNSAKRDGNDQGILADRKTGLGKHAEGFAR